MNFWSHCNPKEFLDDTVILINNWLSFQFNFGAGHDFQSHFAPLIDENYYQIYSIFIKILFYYKLLGLEPLVESDK